MNDFIKQQQELAKNNATAFTFNPVHEPNERYEFFPEDLDTLITQIITNTGEELMRLIEGEIKECTKCQQGHIPVGMTEDGDVEWGGCEDCVVGGSYVPQYEEHNQAIDTLKKHITNVTGVE